MQSDQFTDPFWRRLEEHERHQFHDYVEMLARDPEVICSGFNQSRRAEFARLLTKGLDLQQQVSSPS